jgi:hypothetical protein
MSKRKPKVVESNSKLLLNFARQYFRAAEAVFEKDPLLKQPLYFLYFHVVELSLKSFLRACDAKPKSTHEIQELLKDAVAHGLGVPDEVEIWGIVNLLAGANSEQAFRYGHSKTSVTQPELNWTRDGVGQLLQIVGRSVDPNHTIGKPGTVVRFEITLGKLVRKPK